jgi:hypothetical protein
VSQTPSSFRAVKLISLWVQQKKCFRRILDCLSLTYIVVFFKRQTSSAEYTAYFVCAPSVCILPQQLRDLLLSHLLQLPIVMVMLLCKLVPYIAAYGRGIGASFLGAFAVL